MKFILACQDDETGGFADRPGDIVSTVTLSKFVVTSPGDKVSTVTLSKFVVTSPGDKVSTVTLISVHSYLPW